MSIKKKIVFIVFVTCIVLAGGILGTVLTSNSKLIKIESENRNNMIVTMINSKIEDKLKDTEIALLSIAENKEVIRLFEKRDRKALLNLLMDGYIPIKNEIAQFQFHLPDSTSFLRLHKPEK